MKDLIYSFLLKLLNLNFSEVPRVVICWIVTFLHKFSVIIGFTLITVYFVSNFGIKYLPFLFLAHAVGIMLGSLVFASVLARFKKETLIVMFVLSSAIFLFVSTLVSSYSSVLFLVLYFIGLSVLMGQLKIVRMLFVESQFTPNQAVRVFPVIESAETFGIIFAGILIAAFATTLSFNKFVYIWILALLLIVPIVTMFSTKSIYLQLEGLHFDKKAKIGNEASNFKSYLTKIHRLLRNKTVFSFILIVLFQWIFFTVIEYEYTKSVEHLSHSVELQAESDHHYQSDFAEDLGRLQIYIGSSALLFQLVLASRLLNYMGIVGSLMLYPIVLFVAIFSYLFNPSFSNLLISRFGHEMTNVLHYNAYHTSYYAFDHLDRNSLMEFVEGIVRPIGAIIATLLVFAIEYFVILQTQSMAFAISMIVVLTLLLLFTINFKFEFEESHKNDLLESDSIIRLIDALNLLKENFSVEDTKHLMNVLIKRRDLPVEVSTKIIETIAEFGNLDDVSFLIDEVEADFYSKYLLFKAIYKIIIRYGSELKLKPFTFEAINNLLNKYEQSHDRELVLLVNSIRLSILHYTESLHKHLSSKFELHGGNLLISSYELFSSISDFHSVSYLKSYLSDPDAKVKIAALFALSKFIPKQTVNEIVGNLLESDKDSIESALLYLIKSNKYTEYFVQVTSLRSANLVSAQICLLIDIITCLKNSSFVKMQLIFENVSTQTLAWLKQNLEYLNNALVNKYFYRAVESKIHYYLSVLASEVDDSEFVLCELEQLFAMIDSNKDFYLVKELLDL